MKKPLLSVVMITYNHENYIKQAIESVLMQECDFDYELIVSNDKSPDDSDVIIEKMISEHPKANKIKYHLQENNLGMMPNFIFTLAQAKSKYIALCEGDDYWIDPLKLQKQVDFLEANNDYALCGHLVDVLNFDNSIKKRKANNLQNEIIKQSDLPTIHIPTLSAVFRNCLSIADLQYFRKVPYGDLILFALLGNYGKIIIMHEYMATYRQQLLGVWSGASEVKKLKNGIVTFSVASQIVSNDLEYIIRIYRMSKAGLVTSIKTFDFNYFNFFLKTFFKFGLKKRF